MIKMTENKLRLTAKNKDIKTIKICQKKSY